MTRLKGFHYEETYRTLSEGGRVVLLVARWAHVDRYTQDLLRDLDARGLPMAVRNKDSRGRAHRLHCTVTAGVVKAVNLRAGGARGYEADLVLAPDYDIVRLPLALRQEIALIAHRGGGQIVDAWGNWWPKGGPGSARG